MTNIEPKFQVSDKYSSCKHYTPRHRSQYRWYVPSDRHKRKTLVKTLTERLDLLKRGEVVPKSTRKSKWHCTTCRVNMTRGYLQHVKNEDLRILLAEKDILRELFYAKKRHNEIVLLQAYPDVTNLVQTLGLKLE